jgi:hypothetical protein
MERDYSKYLIRDQDGETRRTLDLLQGWGLPVRESIRSRLGRALMTVRERLRQGKPARRPELASSSQCALR